MKKAFGCLLRGTALIVMLGIIGVIAVSIIGGDDEDKSDPDATSTPAQTVSQFGITMEIEDDNWESTAEGCVGTGPWQELRAGETVMVTDVNETESDAAGVMPANGLIYEDADGSLSCMAAINLPFTAADSYYITIGGILAECDSSLVYPNDDIALISLVLADGKMTCESLDD